MKDFGYSDEIEERAYLRNCVSEYVISALIGCVGLCVILNEKWEEFRGKSKSLEDTTSNK